METTRGNGTSRARGTPRIDGRREPHHQQTSSSTKRKGARMLENMGRPKGMSHPCAKNMRERSCDHPVSPLNSCSDSGSLRGGALPLPTLRVSVPAIPSGCPSLRNLPAARQQSVCRDNLLVPPVLAEVIVRRVENVSQSENAPSFCKLFPTWKKVLHGRKPCAEIRPDASGLTLAAGLG